MEAQNNNAVNGKKPLNKKLLIILGAIFAIIIAAIIIISCVDLFNGKKVNEDIKYINDKVNSKLLQYEVTGVRNSKEFTASDYTYPYTYTTENNFLIVYLTIRNIGNSDIDVQSSYVSLHQGNRTYKKHVCTTWIIEGFKENHKINAGLSKSFVIVFETPTASSVEEYYLYVKGSASTPNEQILLRTRSGGNGEPGYDYGSGGGYY